VPARVSEAIVLRTYPLKEADLIVSFLTRDQGILRGVAKRARRPKSAFGAGLERLSQVRMSYFQRETRELVNLDSCELVRSRFGLLSDYEAGVSLDYFAEVTEQLLPPAEPNERWFRLLAAVVDQIEPGCPDTVWRGVAYFSFWAVRLAGYLPDIEACARCGAPAGETVFFGRGCAGVLCQACRGVLGSGNTWELGAPSRALAGEMQRRPVGQLPVARWSRETAADLRRFLVQQMESHIERRLLTVPVLESASEPQT
jgi:DNA repair protein RecO (recombination protein O)